MTDTYDSRPDTYKHIQRVREYMGLASRDLQRRALEHDQSKLHEPELTVWDRMTPRLASLTYGSPEYKASLKELGPAVEHHYQVSDHHPEHFPNGVNGMTLMALIEMLCDWKAASERVAPVVGQTEAERFRRSLLQNDDRFGISEQLSEIIVNTAVALGFIEKEDDGEEDASTGDS